MFLSSSLLLKASNNFLTVSFGKPSGCFSPRSDCKNSWAFSLCGSIYPASRIISSAIIWLDFSMATASFPGSPAAIFSCSDLLRVNAFSASITGWVLFCCFGYSFGTIEIAPDGQASAQSPQPMHLSTSIILFSVSVAPVGQT